MTDCRSVDEISIISRRTFMNTIFFLLLALTHVNEIPVIEDQVDKIVLVHSYYIDYSEGDTLETVKITPMSNVLIFYDWDDHTNKFQIAAYRLMHDWDRYEVTRDFKQGGYYIIFDDYGWGDYTRKVRAKAYEEKWVEYDMEDAEEKFWPSNRRRGLTNGFHGR